MKNSVAFFVLLTILGHPIVHFAQGKVTCGANAKPYIMGMMGNIPNESECTYIKQVKRTLQISLHVCLDEAGLPGVTQTQLNNALNRLNQDFAPCGLQFEYCRIEQMPDFQFDEFKDVDDEDQMTLMYYQPNTINVYVCKTVETQAAGVVGGYAYFPGGKDVIVLAKNALSNRTFSHEMGHFFGLFHTFETDNGTELVDGSNCETAGDLICDTAADPDPNGNANPGNSCNYTGPVATDGNGDYYVPPTYNIMSYYPDACTCRFTPQQFNRMTSQYLLNRSYLW